MADIGEEIREGEIIPADVPADVPDTEPVPIEEPVPA